MKRLIRIVSLALCMSVVGICLCVPAAADAASASSYDDFFSDSVFLGDSITVALEEYVDGLRSSDSKAFADAEFLAKVSYGVRGSLNDDGYELHPNWEGKQLQPQKSIAKIGPSKVFILLGINDIKEDLNETITAYKELIARVKAANSGISIYIQSVLPMTARKEASNMSNSRIDSFNEKLQSMCSSLGLTYIDISGYFKDSNGRLKSACSSDDYVHLSKEGYAVWVQALREYAAKMSGKATVFNVSSAVNLRQSASTSAPVIAKLRNDAALIIEEAFVDYQWHKVSYNGKTGYIHRDFVYLDTAAYSPGKIIKVDEFVNARNKPNTSSDIVCTIAKGKSVKVIKAYSVSNWYLVYYNHQYMYVRKDFVSLD